MVVSACFLMNHNQFVLDVCSLVVLDQQLQSTTVYEISKGGVTTPLDGVDGVTVNDNGTLFVEDASAVFAEGD